MSCFGTREQRVSIYCQDCGRMAFGKVPIESVTKNCVFCNSNNIQLDYVNYKKKTGIRNALFKCIYGDSYDYSYTEHKNTGKNDISVNRLSKTSTYKKSSDEKPLSASYLLKLPILSKS